MPRAWGKCNKLYVQQREEERNRTVQELRVLDRTTIEGQKRGGIKGLKVVLQRIELTK